MQSLSLVVLVSLGCTFIEGSSTPSVSSFAPEGITLREVPGSDFKELVDEQLVYIDAGGTSWIAPKGTWTDGATVPRLVLAVTDDRFDSRILKAAVIHDAYCQQENADRTPEQYQSRSWRAVHRMFFEAALSGGTPSNRARLMFAAVWLGGPRWNDPEHDLSKLTQEVLLAEYEACRKWIEANEPSREEIEAWMDRRESDLLSQH